MDNRLNVEDFLAKSKGGVIIDVRSPSEYRNGHIEGAYNIPLFSDEERAVVGTIYTQTGKEEAVEKGLEFVSRKMIAFVRQAKELSNGRRLCLYCWRGGMRSGSMAWLFSTAGMKTYVLEGGYKAYRNALNATVEKFRGKLIVLGGPTGGGKSEILSIMSKLGEQVLDLEGLANHKGSAFGGLGAGKQPTTETFINKIHHFLSHADPNRTLWCEGESKSIGSVYIPDAFFNLMRESTYIYMDVPIEIRIERLVKEYGNIDKNLLKESFIKITKRLGGQNCADALDAIEKGNLAKAAGIALLYYDKSYKTSISKMGKIVPLQTDEDNPLENAKKIIDRFSTRNH